MLLKKLSDQCWFIDPGPTSERFLLTCAVSEDMARAPTHAWFSAALVTTNPIDFSLVVLDKELWSNCVFTVNPKGTLADIVQDFLRCSNPGIPIELAYQWGGQVCGEPVKTLTTETIQ